MLIGIEGCIGSGKTTLLQWISRCYSCYPVYEEPEQNPFLEDFYREGGKRTFARHALYSFLFLQERQLRRMLPLSEQGHLVVTDFHPLKNLVFGNILLPARDQALLTEIYDRLALPEPDMMIYLRADEDILLARLRKKQRPHLEQLDFTFLTQLRDAYEAFFRTYPNRSVTIDTSRLDYFERSQEDHVSLTTLQKTLENFSLLKVQAEDTA
jgi:deoxyguanosine kinase